LQRLQDELQQLAKDEDISLADALLDDVLIYAQFPQIGLKFLKNRGNPNAFEPMPSESDVIKTGKSGEQPSAYNIGVDGEQYHVTVSPAGEVTDIQVAGGQAAVQANTAPAPSGNKEVVSSPLAGNIFKVQVKVGDAVNDGDVLVVLEAMKMETEIRASSNAVITDILIKEGDAVQVGDALVEMSS